MKKSEKENKNSSFYFRLLPFNVKICRYTKLKCTRFNNKIAKLAW